MERVKHECEENDRGLAIVYNRKVERWHLRGVGDWMIYHCPYCGLKLEKPEPPKPEFDTDRQCHTCACYEMCTTAHRCWGWTAKEPAPPDTIEVKRETMERWSEAAMNPPYIPWRPDMINLGAEIYEVLHSDD